MHDIKIQPSSQKKPDFEMAHISGDDERSAEPGEKVKVKFSNFVQLVATHDFEGVMKCHSDDDIIVNTNLLTDLANAHEENSGEHRKLPILFIVGIIIGIVITYIITRF